LLPLIDPPKRLLVIFRLYFHFRSSNSIVVYCY
jgi:hypothetical protein